jgi:hypothetical protein
MSLNPYEVPQDPAEVSRDSATRGRWRLRCKWLCLGSLALALVLLVISSAVAPLRTESASAAFLLFDGLLALGELGSFAVAGLAAIGWAILPRKQPV